MGETIAKPHQPIAFLGQTEERDSRFPRERPLVLIKDDKYVGWENLMALKVIILYLNKIRYERESQCSFFKKGSDTACFIQSKKILQRTF